MTDQKISDYAMIGDCETAALVGRDGSIDWLCWPRFDSGACFAALLGTADHGRWKIAPSAPAEVTRSYQGDTLILETTFRTASGVASIIDFMPLRGSHEVSDIIRIVQGQEGEVEMEMEMSLRFDYGRVIPWVSRLPGPNRLRAVAGPHAVILDAPVHLTGEDMKTTARFTVRAGDRLPFTMAYEASHLPLPDLAQPEEALEDTRAYWEEWAAKCTHDGPWRAAVMRSLITVKAMTYRPTGGIIAAPTTSLPETVGGERNWDYRYCWLRDATFTLLTLVNAGYREEAERWCDWLLRAIAGAAVQTQPLYGIGGEHRCDEMEIDWLPGHRGSAPVRTGNAAYSQLQVDVFGSVIDALYEAECRGLELNEAATGLKLALLRHLEDVWREPDEGIWEVRSGRQHFVHAKLMSWVAFDRAISSAERFGLEGPVDRWRAIREEIRAEIMEKGFSEKRQAFAQAYGSDALDASVLLMPIVGFLPGDDPRMISTVAAIERDLTRDGLVLRYDTGEADDGLEGEEGAFLACSFWLADNLVLQGRRDDAKKLFDRLIGFCNDVGLLAEQYDWDSAEQVGNFPQAFSHFALIDTAFNLNGGGMIDRREVD